MNILPRSFYERSTVQVAQDLLGKIIVRVVDGVTLAGIIVETEAYCGLVDEASHAFIGQTKRNAAMFGTPGHSYVYFTYGNHYCLNLVAKEKGVPAGGVLIRGLVPFQGIDEMKKIRGTQVASNLLSGPGKIGQAFQLSLSDNLIDLTKKGALYVTEGFSVPADSIEASPRVGISKAKELLWRFTPTKAMYDQIKHELWLMRPENIKILEQLQEKVNKEDLVNLKLVLGSLKNKK